MHNFADMVLGHELINTETMYTQSVYLRHLSVKNLTKLVRNNVYCINNLEFMRKNLVMSVALLLSK